VLRVCVGVTIFQNFFTVACGVRQGGVLSPYLFAIYVDDIVAKINTSDLCGRIGLKGIAIVLYADDILLGKLITIVEQELSDLDMSLNTKKSVCIRFGPRFQTACCSLKSISGELAIILNGFRHAAISEYG